ncbi:MAG: SulP family inorganic anion transporter [Deferribacterales bacterium]
MGFIFNPALFKELRNGYSVNKLSQDVVAGIIVGIVALPLAIAFAIASGVSPQQGIYTAVVAGFAISFFSGSKFQIGGPTGAFIVVVLKIVTDHGYSGLAMATLMAGFFLILMGLAKMGNVIKFIPYPMTVGFTAGIALIIAITQVKDLFGLTLASAPEGLIDRIEIYVESASTVNWYSFALAAFCIFVILTFGKITRKVPGSIIAIIVSTVIVQMFDIPVETIGSLFGDIPRGLPKPSIPEFSLSRVPDLIGPALTITILGAIESLLSAVVADGMKGTRHCSNTELIGQGIANILSPIFSGIPATGAIARTATNIKNGACTPVSGIVHAATLFTILIFFSGYAKMIPMASLAAVLLVVAYHMSEWKHFLKLMKSPATDILVMVATFLLTVFVDLTIAIQVGVVLSALLFMNRMSATTDAHYIRGYSSDTHKDNNDIDPSSLPEGVDVFEIHGPFFFGAANHFKDTISIVEKPPKVLILRMRHINMIDATAMRALEDVIEKASSEKTTLMFSGVSKELMAVLKKSGIDKKIGTENIFPHINDALTAAEYLVRS